MESKYWSEMYISDNNNDDKQLIISKDRPVGFDTDKNIKLFVGINPENYDEVASFYQKYNQMSTGNTTLLPVDDLKRYLSMNNISILMRSSNGMLIGTIISILLPIKCNNTVITHGCTTFLAVHPGLRKMGLCMAMIRKLIEVGYEQGLYCDYHMVAFPIGDNSIPLNSWYRPIDINRSKELGFLYDGWKDPRNSTKIRLKYNSKLPPSCSYVLVDNTNCNVSLEYYLKIVEKTKFGFYPDKNTWQQWINAFPTYLIYQQTSNKQNIKNQNKNKQNKIVGLVSINTIYCIITQTKETGRIMFPIICDGDMDIVLKVTCSIAYDKNYDVVYFHEHGNVTSDCLSRINSIKTTTKLWFSLYNNRIKLDVSDIHIPLL